MRGRTDYRRNLGRRVIAFCLVATFVILMLERRVLQADPLQETKGVTDYKQGKIQVLFTSISLISPYFTTNSSAFLPSFSRNFLQTFSFSILSLLYCISLLSSSTSYFHLNVPLLSSLFILTSTSAIFHLILLINFDDACKLQQLVLNKFNFSLIKILKMRELKGRTKGTYLESRRMKKG